MRLAITNRNWMRSRPPLRVRVIVRFSLVGTMAFRVGMLEGLPLLDGRTKCTTPRRRCRCRRSIVVCGLSATTGFPRAVVSAMSHWFDWVDLRAPSTGSRATESNGSCEEI